MDIGVRLRYNQLGIIHTLEKEYASVRRLPGYIHSLAINESASKLAIGYTNVEGVHIAFVEDPCGG